MGPGTESLVRKVKLSSHFKLKHLIWMCNGSRKFACFLIFGNAKTLTNICVFLQKNDV